MNTFSIKRYIKYGSILYKTHTLIQVKKLKFNKNKTNKHFIIIQILSRYLTSLRQSQGPILKLNTFHLYYIIILMCIYLMVFHN